MKHALTLVAATGLVLAAGAAFAQSQVVPPVVSGSISGPNSGTNPVNPAPSGFHKRLGDVTDNRSTTSTGDARVATEDGALLGRVVSALASDPALRGAQLQVEVDNGVVGITGQALDPAQAQRAGMVAAQAANGARVESDIDVDAQ